MIQHSVAANSEEKWCGLVSEFGRVCERRKLRVIVGKRKVVKCSRFVNVGRIIERLNGEWLEEVAYFKYLGLQVATDGGCENDMVH